MPKSTLSWLALLLALTLVRGLIYAAVIPPWQSPDEPFHFVSSSLSYVAAAEDSEATWQQLKEETVASLYQFKFWDWLSGYRAARDPGRVYAQVPGGLEAESFPGSPRSPVYYLMSPALGMSAYQGPTFQLYLGRVLSILINMGIVAIAFWVGRLLFGSEPFGLVLLPLSIVFLPQHTFILASLTDANPAELFVSIAIGALILCVVKGFQWYMVLVIFLFGGLAAAAKPTAYFFVPVAGLVLVIFVWRKMKNWQRLLLLPAAVLLIYGLTRVSTRLEHWLLRVLDGGFFASTADGSLGGIRNSVFDVSLFSVFKGFWVFLGWNSVPISDSWGWVLAALTLLALVGLGIFAWRRFRAGGDLDQGRRSLSRAVAVFALLLLVDVALIVLASAQVGVPLYLSRYLFGAIIPLMALLVVGWRELLPTGWRVEGLAFVVSFLFLFDAIVLLHHAVPFFYPLWR